MSRAIRFFSGLPLYCWGDCVMTTTYITNKLPSTVHKGKSPNEVCYEKKPNYNMMKCFGCLAMAYNPDRRKYTFGARGIPRVFIGYSNTQKGYKLHNLVSGESFVSRYVKFHDNPDDIFYSTSQKGIDLCEPPK